MLPQQCSPQRAPSAWTAAAAPSSAATTSSRDTLTKAEPNEQRYGSSRTTSAPSAAARSVRAIQRAFIVMPCTATSYSSGV